jgi:DNA-binding NarL/FixJ family response regulator
MSRPRSLRDSGDMQKTASPTRVFLADDSALSRRRVAEMLTAQGMVVVGQADTAESAVSGILASQPDVVVLDVQFKKGTGMQVLKAVFNSTRDIPFIMLSNHTEAAYRARYLAAGAACFLDKHAEFYQLCDAVARIAPLRLLEQPVSLSQPKESTCF